MNFLIRGKVSLPLPSDENKKKYINDESKKNRRKSFIRKGGGAGIEDSHGRKILGLFPS